jgi:hypothetical protein
MAPTACKATPSPPMAPTACKATLSPDPIAAPHPQKARPDQPGFFVFTALSGIHRLLLVREPKVFRAEFLCLLLSMDGVEVEVRVCTVGLHLPGIDPLISNLPDHREL